MRLAADEYAVRLTSDSIALLQPGATIPGLACTTGATTDTFDGAQRPSPAARDRVVADAAPDVVANNNNTWWRIFSLLFAPVQVNQSTRRMRPMTARLGFSTYGFNDRDNVNDGGGASSVGQRRGYNMGLRERDLLVD
jgi:hypothetical protein